MRERYNIGKSNVGKTGKGLRLRCRELAIEKEKRKAGVKAIKLFKGRNIKKKKMTICKVTDEGKK